VKRNASIWNQGGILSPKLEAPLFKPEEFQRRKGETPREGWETPKNKGGN